MTRHRIGLTIAAALLLAACQSSASPTPPSSTSPTAAVGSSTATSASPPAASSAAPSAATPGATAAASSSAPTLQANLCDMLDPATIKSITGLTVAAGRAIAGDASATGHCLWAATTSLGLELTAYTEAQIAPKMAASVPGFSAVAGLGNGAKGAVTTLPGTTVKVASLLVDFGSYGLLFALNAPAASVDQDVQLAAALK